jgi:hypothetical protein
VWIVRINGEETQGWTNKWIDYATKIQEKCTDKTKQGPKQIIRPIGFCRYVFEINEKPRTYTFRGVFVSQARTDKEAIWVLQ